jgi:CheY-like chemotaxis protein
MPRIIIIEDDELIARLYEKAFGFEGYDVEVAHNGREGLDLVRTSDPTLILLDIMMPEMNGLEVLDHLKGNEKTKDIPVVVLTNLSGEHDAEEVLSKGAVKYIVKSEHNPKEIVDIVKGILSGYTRDDLPPVV